MEIRLAAKEDLERLKLIWKLCFGDEDRYIDFYFENRNWTEETAVLLLGEEIVSMLSMIPASLTGSDGKTSPTAMLYAIATHPEFQKKGLAEKLIEFSNQYLFDRQNPSTVLVPAEEELFSFYKKRGYQEGFFLNEIFFSKEELENLSSGKALSTCRMISAEPQAYNAVRKEFLKGTCFVDYSDEEILFQKKEAQFYGLDIYLISAAISLDDNMVTQAAAGSDDVVIGCATVEKSMEKVIVKELLVPDRYLVSAVKAILNQIDGDSYLLRTPPGFGSELRGELRPFGMIKSNRDGLQEDYLPSYLGIAYD